MLIKINNKKIVDTTKTPAIILLEPHEIDMIKDWKQNEDMIFSHPSSWTQQQAGKFMDQKKFELVALHVANQRNIAEEKAQNHESSNDVETLITCMHGIVQKDGKPKCPECTKIAKELNVDNEFFESASEIDDLSKAAAKAWNTRANVNLERNDTMDKADKE